MSEAARSIEVLAAGALDSVQDGGRRGLRALGIGSAGAADTWSARIANLLVGNAEDAALLETTLLGPRLRVAQHTRIAITGAEIEAFAGDSDAPLPLWRPLDVPQGTEIALRGCRRGVRAYVAFDGGIAVPAVLGARATDLRGGFGGCEGRALRTGDVLPLGPSSAPQAAGHGRVRAARWWVDPTPDLDLALPPVCRLLPGGAALRTDATQALFAEPFTVAAASNRVGVRLQGPPLALAQAWSVPSEPVLPGTVQLPPDGQPIVLLADCGTAGGYARIGHVAEVDLPRVAQLRPGEQLRFVRTSLAECDRRACEREARLARIGLAIDSRTRHGR